MMRGGMVNEVVDDPENALDPEPDPEPEPEPNPDPGPEPGPDDEPDAPDEPPGALSYPDLLKALGYDPALVQAVILTPTSAVAIATDYPEPHTPPDEETDHGSH